MMTITEWFAREVAAGLIQEWENIYARCIVVADMSYCCIRNGDESDNICTQSNLIEQFDEPIQLRKDGKDLYELEWRKPTQKDVLDKKMAWFKTNCDGYFELSLLQLDNDSDIQYQAAMCGCRLLADHGQIAPTEQDFKRIYGE